MEFSFKQLQEVIDLLVEISPGLWGIYMREVEVQANVAGIWGVFCAVFAIFCLVAFLGSSKWTWANVDGDEDAVIMIFVVVLSLMGFIAFGIGSADNFIDMYHWKANPEGKAVQLLLDSAGLLR